MPVLKFKWNKSIFDDVSIDPAEGVEGLKRQLYQLTGVPIDRQKHMCKGVWSGTLKDDSDISSFTWTDGTIVTMMGSADVLSQTEIVKFVEDMTESEKVGSGAVKVSAGLTNLGNTCYMNSTVQCLRHIENLRDVLKKGVVSSDPTAPIVSSLNDTFRQLDLSASAVTPGRLVLQIRQLFPQFAERSNHGHFLQQDAEEFLNVLTQTLHRNFEATTPDIKNLLGVELEENLTCVESTDEPVVQRKEKITKVVCSIQGGLGSVINIDHMHEGIKLWLEGNIQKNSNILGRDAIWKRQARISHLPKFLCIQYLRFFWKPTPESADHAGVKCKILRPVSFPEVLDVYQFCNDEIQSALKENREAEDKEIEEAAKRARIEEAEMEPTATAAASEQAGEAMDVTEEDEEKALQAALALSLGAEPAITPKPTPSVIAHLPQGFTGMYELHSLVTHKGRSADSGHYIGWARQSPGSDLWWKYDDDKVTETTTEEIMKLKGGGDRDMVYLVFYRARDSKNEK